MYLGIEIGGTKLQLGLGPGDGTLVGLWRQTVDAAAGPEGIRRQVEIGLAELLGQAGVKPGGLRGAGIGFGGPVDDATQAVIKSHQVEGWDGFPLAAWVGERAGCPAALGNDADVAGLAEVCFGAGRGVSPVFYITVGSGIGGGFLVNGEIYRGAGRGAAEIGHLRVTRWAHGSLERCALEEAASGWSIEQQARAEVAGEAGHNSLLSELAGRADRITARHLAEAEARGDAFAGAILRRAWTYLAEGICQVIALLCPRRIIIGGGISLMGEPQFFAPLRELVAERVFPPFASSYEIVPAALGEEVVVHGALALARRRFGGGQP